MRKFRKLLKIIGLIIRQPWRLNSVLEERSVWETYVINHYQLTHGLPVVPFTQLAGEQPVSVEPYAFLEGGSLPTDLCLLKSLAMQIPDCRYFEIGTWRGESVANIAAVAKECVTLNLSREEIRSIGYSSEYADAHFFFCQSLPNVKIIEDNTLHFPFHEVNEKFDLVFIDGDHHYDMVRHDTEKVFSHLVHDHSIVVWHDYAHNPEMPRFEVLAAILDGMPADKRATLYHVSNTLCAIWYPKTLKGNTLQYPHKPLGHFRVKLDWVSEKA
ncbi:MAG: class I SAM-dependent methyltransferase [Bacteroidetes bacterium]|nr:class I SAM-dependent methyltransferase [Bacteroidota bacterium]